MSGMMQDKRKKIGIKAKHAKERIKEKAPRITGRVEALKISREKEEKLDFRFESCFLDDVIDEITTGDVFLMRGTECNSQKYISISQHN